MDRSENIKCGQSFTATYVHGFDQIEVIKVNSFRYRFWRADEYIWHSCVAVSGSASAEFKMV